MDAESLKVKNPELLEYCGPTSVGGLITRIASSPLVWTDAKPTVPGWYWWRAPYSHPEMIHLFRITEDSPLIMNRRNGTYMAPNVGQFAGPIPQPEEPRQ